jgi:hypothetical protein
LGVEADIETAVFYQRLPGRVTADEFHVVGAQAIVETDRINDSTAPEVIKTDRIHPLHCFIGDRFTSDFSWQ